MIFSLRLIIFLEEKIIKESKNESFTKSSPIFSRNFSIQILVKLSDAKMPKMAKNQVAKKIQPVKGVGRCPTSDVTFAGSAVRRFFENSPILRRFRQPGLSDDF